MHFKKAFSLVELSIVLVILGLLVGGILAGQSLVRASELRSVTAQYQGYVTAVNSFKDKYFSLPGDITNATLIWGKDNTNCAGNTGTAATPGTCNGNGDGAVGGAMNITNEAYRFWQHLASAGLIEGTYASALSNYGSAPTIGTDVPAAKLGSNTYWTVNQMSQSNSVNSEFGYSDLPDVRSTYLLLASPSTGLWAGGAVMTPQELFNIDTKLDDGRPATGLVRGGGPVAWGCATTIVSTTAAYVISTTSKTCMTIGFLLK